MHRFVLRSAAAFAFLASGCGPKVPPEAPINNADQMCCAKGDTTTGVFGGCEMSPRVRQCPEDRPLWLRGVVNCGPVDEAACLGGRCCTFGKAWGSEDATLDWDPPGSVVDAAQVTPTDEDGPATEATSDEAGTTETDATSPDADADADAASE